MVLAAAHQLVMRAVTTAAVRWMRDRFSYGKIDGLAPTDRNSNMKLRKLLGECCPQYASRLEDMKFQKAQKDSGAAEV